MAAPEDHDNAGIGDSDIDRISPSLSGLNVIGVAKDQGVAVAYP